MLEVIQVVETTLFQLKVLHSFYQDVSEKEKYSGVISRWPVIHRKMLPVIAEFHLKFVAEIGGFQEEDPDERFLNDEKIFLTVPLVRLVNSLFEIGHFINPKIKCCKKLSVPKIMEEVYFSNDHFLSNYTKYAHGIAHDKIDQSDDNFKTLDRLFEYEKIHFTFLKNLFLENTRKNTMQNLNPFLNSLKFRILD